MQINTSLRAKNLRGPQSRRVRGIVLHDTAGSGTIGDVHYLATDPEHRGVSVDYVVTRDGTCWQLNPDPRKYYTFHAGRHTKFRDMINGGVNAGTIGIEISHKADPSKQTPEWPSNQIEAVADLCKQLCQDYHLTADDITTHARVITDRSRSDPRNFPFAQFWGRFNGDIDLIAPIAPAADNILQLPDLYWDIQAGDTLWGLAQKFKTTVEAIKALNGMNTTSNMITVGQHLRVK